LSSMLSRSMDTCVEDTGKALTISQLDIGNEIQLMFTPVGRRALS